MTQKTDHRYPPTVFIDLDGVIVTHRDPFTWYEPLELCDGVYDVLRRWWDAGVRIIITTGRPECVRQHTELELTRLRVFYHKMVMDCGSGVRYIVNDRKPYNSSLATAKAVMPLRNEGLAWVADQVDVNPTE